MLVDAAAYYFVLKPEAFDVVVGSNLFVDLLTDLAAAITGGWAWLPAQTSTRKAVFRAFLSRFTARPGYCRQGHCQFPILDVIALRLCQEWAEVFRLEHLGQREAAAAVLGAVEEVLGAGQVRTPDLVGRAVTREFAAEVVRALKNLQDERTARPRKAPLRTQSPPGVGCGGAGPRRGQAFRP